MYLFKTMHKKCKQGVFSAYFLSIKLITKVQKSNMTQFDRSLVTEVNFVAFVILIVFVLFLQA